MNQHKFKSLELKHGEPHIIYMLNDPDFTSMDILLAFIFINRTAATSFVIGNWKAHKQYNSWKNYKSIKHNSVEDKIKAVMTYEFNLPFDDDILIMPIK